MFLDIHVLQSVPPANINRDDSGSPKTAYYGGVKRARVSSQSWKRAARKALAADPAMATESATRTRLLPGVLAARLTELDARLSENAAVIGELAVKGMFKAKLTEKKARTEYLLFLGYNQIERVVDRLAGRTDDLASAGEDRERITEIIGELNLRELGITGHAGAVALFGRMIADDPDTNVDAACQVAHALSTHAVRDEYDYFTAVDDEQPDGESGAGMISSTEFNSATLYRYATVDLRSLVENLDGESDRAADIAIAFARTFATSMPTGKRNTFANNTRPDLVVLSVRNDQPLSLVGAFENPVPAQPEGGLMAASARELARELTEQDAMYGTTPVCTVASYPGRIADALAKTDTPELPESQPLPAALGQVRAVLSQHQDSAA